MSSYLDYEGLSLYHENNKNYIDGKIPTKTSELTNDNNFVNTNTLNTSLNTKAPKEHTHEISDVDGLQDELDNYASKTDIPTLVAGNNITLTPNTNTNEITISSTGGGSGSSDASGINYDNTTSGLSATEVQSAIDELNGDLSNMLKISSIKDTTSDLNNFTETGIYSFNYGSAPTNVPVGSNGILCVTNIDKFVKQIWYRYGTPGSNDSDTYVRTYSTSKGWSSWTKYATHSDLSSYSKLTYSSTEPTSNLSTNMVWIG